MRASAALDIPFTTGLPPAPEASISFPWLRLAGALEAMPASRDLMYEVEMLQIYEQSPALQKIADGADPIADPIDSVVRKRLADNMRRSPMASRALCEHLDEVSRRL